MKKNLIAFLAAVTLGVSANLSAAVITSGNPITPDATGCIVLAETVRLSLSSGVHGAYNCDDNRNAVNVGACHIGGSRSTSFKCAVIGQDANNNPIYNHTDCPAATGDTITLTTPGYRGFRASTTGGSVGAQQLTGACSGSTANTELVDFR